MPFQEAEESLEAGRPLGFYFFALGDLVWRYTTAEEDIVLGGHTWQAAAISDDGVRQTGEVQSDALSINAPFSIGPSQLFMSGAPSKDIQVMIYQKHDQMADLRPRYVGFIEQINYPTPGTCRVICSTLSSTMRRQGLRQCWQRGCTHFLYDPVNCKVDKTLWRYPFTVLSVQEFGLTVEVLGAPGTALAAGGSGYLNNGYFEWNHPIRGIEQIGIDSHVYQPVAPNIHAVVLLSDPGEVFAGATGFVYRGCSFTPASCQSFGNYDNYGGCPDMPGRSIFDGNPVF